MITTSKGGNENMVVPIKPQIDAKILVKRKKYYLSNLMKDNLKRVFLLEMISQIGRSPMDLMYLLPRKAIIWRSV